MPASNQFLIKNRLLLVLIFFDAAVVLAHLFLKNTYGFFNLDKERNLASVYSGLKLLLIGVLAAGNFLLFKKMRQPWGRRLLWFTAAGLFFYLALDEMMELHERLGFVFNNLTGLTGFRDASFNWWIYFMPLVALALVVLVRMIFSLWREDKKSAILSLIGAIIFVLALTAEVVGGKVYQWGWPRQDFQMYFNFIVLEEGLEMLGASFFLAAFVQSVKTNFKKVYELKFNGK